MTEQIEVKREPLFNIPPVTGILVGLIVVLHLLRLKLPYWGELQVVTHYAFIPAEFMTDPLRHLYTLATYAGLHFGALHLAINSFGLLAFGSGVEKMLGRWRMFFILLLGIIGGVLGHLILFADSDVPLCGISAGVSALFGALLWLMGGNARNAITASCVFIVTNIVVGMMGMPDQPGLAIAWQAHIAGFITGLIMVVIFSKGVKHAAE